MSTWEPNADRETAAGSVVEVGRDEAGEDQLAHLAGLPLAEHPAVYERIHGELQSALTDIDGA